MPPIPQGRKTHDKGCAREKDVERQKNLDFTKRAPKTRQVHQRIVIRSAAKDLLFAKAELKSGAASLLILCANVGYHEPHPLGFSPPPNDR